MEHVRSVVRISMGAAGLAALLAGRAVAQDETCRSLTYRSNFRLNGAQQHIALADQSAYADTKRSNAQDAIRTLTEAVQSGREGGADPFSTWYLFGRAYLLLNDLAGADSAFTKAAALAPRDQGCQDEMRRLRHNAWVPLQQRAVDQIQAGHYDSAMALLRRSNVIYRDDPGGYMNMASVFLSQQQDDSAALALKMAARAGTDPARASVRAQAALNAARLLARDGHLAEADTMYREYIAMKPADMAARGALASVLAREHRAAEAAAVYDSILGSADSLDAFQLFDTGVSLYNLAVTDTASADSAQRAGFFARAARAFQGAVRKNPYYRDGWFDLAETYLAMGDLTGALDASRHLVGVDSLNQQSWSLLAQSYQEQMRANVRRDSVLRARRDSLPAAEQAIAAARAYRDSTLWAVGRRDSLPLEVRVSRFDLRDSTALMRGVVRNLRNAEHAAFPLTIEFLNARGEVVASQRVDVPTLNAAGRPGQAYDFNLEASGRGITAYRYRVG